jgi:hypothetical protein
VTDVNFEEPIRKIPTTGQHTIYHVHIKAYSGYNFLKDLSKSTSFSAGLIAGFAVPLLLMHFVIGPLAMPVAITFLLASVIFLSLAGLGIGETISVGIDKYEKQSLGL